MEGALCEMSNTNIAVTNDVACTLQKIQQLYTDGNIRGFAIQIVQKDDDTVTAHCGELSFIEKLGLIEQAKQDLFVSANS